MKDVKFSSKVVLLVIVINLWFVKEVIELIRDVSIEPTVLIGSWFAWTTGELWMLKEIKKKKIEKEKESDKHDS